MSRRGSKSLEVLAVLAALFLIACTVFLGLVAFGIVHFQTLADDYPQSDLILNCFDNGTASWEPLCVSPTGEYLVAGGFRKLTWITKWNEKNQATAEIQDLDFGERVVSAAFSKDGTRIAVFVRGPEEDAIALLNVSNRQILIKWPTSRSHYDIKLRFSEDGELLFTNPVEQANQLENFGAVTTWETSTGNLVGIIRTPKEFYLGDFSCFQGRLLIAYERIDDYKEIQIYESEKPFSKAKLLVSIKAPDASAFNAVRLSSDATRLAVSSHHAQPMKVYNVSDGRLVTDLQKAHYGVMSGDFPGFAISRNGKYLATSNSGGSGTLWNVATGKELGELKGRRYNGPHNMVFGPDDKTLITCDYHALVIWDISGFINQDQ
jgi:WD40 repeat protein